MSTAKEQIAVSAIVPTRNRVEPLRRMLESMLRGTRLPAELIIVDGSENDLTAELSESFARLLNPLCKLIYLRAKVNGAAIQRNQGFLESTQPWIGFFDDDIVLEPDCLELIWNACLGSKDLGGVNAMITNQRYVTPGIITRLLLTFLNGARRESFAGKVVGPAVHLLPEDGSGVPEIAFVDWLNLGCTFYRREALPSPPFDSVFTGYSLMEDLTLSLRVGKRWKLANARTARIFHDSQPGSHKQSIRALAEMELVNRHYVMTQVLDRKSFGDQIRLLIWELFQLTSLIRTSKGCLQLGETLRGKRDAINRIRSNPNQSHS